jgi:hypothetical protein
MKGIGRQYAAPQAQAELLKPAMVRGILATLGDTLARPRRCANRASFRRRAAALGHSKPRFWRRRCDGDGYLTLTDEAVEIVRSKARTEPSTVCVPRAENPGLSLRLSAGLPSPA